MEIELLHNTNSVCNHNMFLITTGLFFVHKNCVYHLNVLKLQYKSVKPFPHTTNLQQTTLKTCLQKLEKNLQKSNSNY